MLRSDTAEQVVKDGPTSEEIRQRAYEIHVERGGIHGFDLDDWWQADRELQQEHGNHENDSKKK